MPLGQNVVYSTSGTSNKYQGPTGIEAVTTPGVALAYNRATGRIGFIPQIGTSATNDVITKAVDGTPSWKSPPFVVNGENQKLFNINQLVYAESLFAITPYDINIGSDSPSITKIKIGHGTSVLTYDGSGNFTDTLVIGSASQFHADAGSTYRSLMIGNELDSYGEFGICIGSSSSCGNTAAPGTSTSSITIGRSSSTTKSNAISLGNTLTNEGEYHIVIGYTLATSDLSTRSITIGSNSTNLSEGSILLGIGARCDNNTDSLIKDQIAIGSGASAYRDGCIVIGKGAITNSDYVSFTTECDNAIAIGTLAHALRTNVISIGNNAGPTTALDQVNNAGYFPTSLALPASGSTSKVMIYNTLDGQFGPLASGANNTVLTKRAGGLGWQAVAPTTGQILTYNGTDVVWAASGAGGATWTAAQNAGTQHLFNIGKLIYDASATTDVAPSAILIGNFATTASDVDNIVIGHGAGVNGLRGIRIGDGGAALTDGVIIGTGATTNVLSSVGIGNAVSISGFGGVVIGYSSNTQHSHGVVIGHNSQTGGENQTVLGSNTQITDTTQYSLFTYKDANPLARVTAPNDALVFCASTGQIGRPAVAPTSGQVLTYNGTNVVWAAGGGGGGPWTQDQDASLFDLYNVTRVRFNGAIAIGNSSTSASTGSIGIGNNCIANGSNIAIGNSSRTASFHVNNIAIGDGNTVCNGTGDNSVVIGSYLTAIVRNSSSAVGVGYRVNPAFDNCVCLGADTVAKATGQIIIGKGAGVSADTTANGVFLPTNIPNTVSKTHALTYNTSTGQVGKSVLANKVLLQRSRRVYTAQLTITKDFNHNTAGVGDVVPPSSSFTTSASLVRQELITMNNTTSTLRLFIRIPFYCSANTMVSSALFDKSVSGPVSTALAMAWTEPGPGGHGTLLIDHEYVPGTTDERTYEVHAWAQTAGLTFKIPTAYFPATSTTYFGNLMNYSITFEEFSS